MRTCHRTPLVLLSLLALFFAGFAPRPASGQADSLSELTFLAGHWDVTGTALVDGTPSSLTAAATIDWALDDHGLRHHLAGVTDDNQYFQGLGFWIIDSHFQAPAMAWTDTLTVAGLYRVFSSGFEDEELFAYSQDSGPYAEMRLEKTSDDTFEWSFAIAASRTSLPEEVLNLRYTRRDFAPEAAFFPDAAPIPAPPPETDQFAFYVGDWEIESRALVEGDTWIEGPGTAHAEWVLGGHVLEDNWQAPSFFPDANLGWGMTRYNVQTGQWERVTILGPSTGLGRTWEGACVEDECTLTDDRFYQIADGSFQWEHRHGGPDPVWMMDFTRVD